MFRLYLRLVLQHRRGGAYTWMPEKISNWNPRMRDISDIDQWALSLLNRGHGFMPALMHKLSFSPSPYAKGRGVCIGRNKPMLKTFLSESSYLHFLCFKPCFIRLFKACEDFFPTANFHHIQDNVTNPR